MRASGDRAGSDETAAAWASIEGFKVPLAISLVVMNVVGLFSPSSITPALIVQLLAIPVLAVLLASYLDLRKWLWFGDAWLQARAEKQAIRWAAGRDQMAALMGGIGTGWENTPQIPPSEPQEPSAQPAAGKRTSAAPRWSGGLGQSGHLSNLSPDVIGTGWNNFVLIREFRGGSFMSRLWIFLNELLIPFPASGVVGCFLDTLIYNIRPHLLGPNRDVLVVAGSIIAGLAIWSFGPGRRLFRSLFSQSA